VSEDRAELEQALLRDPFDAERRQRYAELLFGAGEHGASLEQWRLLVRQQRDSAAVQLRAAECCKALGDREGQAQHLARARGLPDFAPDDPRVLDLEDEDEGEEPEPTARLRVLAGGREELPPARILSFTPSERVTFSSVVGMEELKKVLRLRIIEPFVRPGLFERFRKKSGGGVLLYGPPGCGKTLMARAISSECNASFTAVGISEVLNMWIGESERNLAAVFEKARADAPAVLFFDELDALAFSRSKAQSEHTRTRVNEFLNQLDGMSGSNANVLVLAATNMPWDVDEAMKRPGRFDRQIFVPPPDAQARAEMFRLKLRDVPIESFDADALGRRAEHFSGADIDGVIERAKDAALADILESGSEREVSGSDLLAAIADTSPSTLEWLKTARNLVKYGGAGASYRDVEQYLRKAKLF
jgi:transitional endoplasmic reticulum ATPase